MQLGISTYTYGWAFGTPGDRPEQAFDERTILELAEQFEVGLIQFGDNYPLHELPEDQLLSLSRQVTERGITLEVGARGLTEDHLHRYIHLCNAVDSHLLRFVIDTPHYEPTIDTISGLLREAIPCLEKAHITLGLENHDRLLTREFAHIVEAVGSKYVGICLDSVNSMGAGEGLTEVVRTLAPHTVNLHIKDFGVKRLPHLMGFQIDGRPAGAGMLNVPWLVEQLRPYGRCQTAVLEQWVVPDTSLAATIRKEREWATESMTYLRNTGLFATSRRRSTVGAGGETIINTTNHD